MPAAIPLQVRVSFVNQDKKITERAAHLIQFLTSFSFRVVGGNSSETPGVQALSAVATPTSMAVGQALRPAHNSFEVESCLLHKVDSPSNWTCAAEPPLAEEQAASKPEHVPSVKVELAKLFQTALQKAFPGVDATAEVVPTNQPKFGDYQCNNAMALFGKLKGQVGPSALVSPSCALLLRTYAARAVGIQYLRVGPLLTLTIGATCHLNGQISCMMVAMQHGSISRQC